MITTLLDSDFFVNFNSESYYSGSIVLLYICKFLAWLRVCNNKFRIIV